MKLIAAALLAFAQVAVAQLQPCQSTTGRSVTVNGVANLAVVPDRVSFSVGVETDAATVSEAFRRNTEKLNAVVAAMKEHGVKAQEIQTSNLNVSSHDDQGKKLPGYRVTNLVTVTRDDLASVGELLQLAISKGANEAGSLQFIVAKQKEADMRGLQLAFEDARAKAEKLAALSGKALGDVVCVSDQGSYPFPGFAAETITVTAAAPSIETGVQQLSYRVGVVFELR